MIVEIIEIGIGCSNNYLIATCIDFCAFRSNLMQKHNIGITVL